MFFFLLFSIVPDLPNPSPSEKYLKELYLHTAIQWILLLLIISLNLKSVQWVGSQVATFCCT